ncbi:phage protein Gp36 family protein [Porphyromonas levii]|uniref:phage protein Gp36 family protein n=1 Tax=Porphyromonas levii TaxID=28114 RepID=UPI0003686196|nr:phage protein Gp36 family protein [Porphyromonas levii]
MAYLTPSELNTHLYNEQLKVIARDDDTIVLSAIDAAISEAKGYLSRYDKERIFSAEGSDRNAILLAFIKDMAVFHFIKLNNYAADLEFRTFLYQRAVDWLKSVQKGSVVPDLPTLDEDGDGNPDNGEFLWGSNPKRTQHY